jgi:hypothetical protein
MRRTTALAGLVGCLLLLMLGAVAVARNFKTHTTLTAPATGTQISGQLSSKNHKCLRKRDVIVDIEPFVASATPRQHPRAKTDASGYWQASATLADRYHVQVSVLSKPADPRSGRICKPARAEQSVGNPEPPPSG